MPIRGQHQSSRRRVKRSGISPATVILAVLLVIALGVIAWLLIKGGVNKPPDNPQPEQTEPVEKLTDSIDIPGFGELHFKAGQTEQNMTVPNPQPEQTEPVEKLTDSIDIPGFGELHFKAGQTEQNMTVPNPPQNFCWFKVSLVLEDGTVLWTSDLIAPGEESEKVVLNEPLEKGEYKNAMLKYQCFADEAEQKALNGAETKLTIIVK